MLSGFLDKSYHKWYNIFQQGIKRTGGRALGRRIRLLEISKRQRVFQYGQGERQPIATGEYFSAGISRLFQTERVGAKEERKTLPFAHPYNGGGAQSSLGLVSYDEKTGLLTAPEGATYSKGGQTFPLDGADPFDLSLDGDDASVFVEGGTRTFDFSRPVGTSFIYRYLTEDGAIVSEVGYSNFERIREGAERYAAMTERQKSVVETKLTETGFGSFEGLLAAVDAYVAEQDRKAEEYFRENETLSKEFDHVTGADRDALNGAVEDYRNASEETQHFLDEAAKEEGYSGFEGKMDDLIAKSEFEAERGETLENLDTLLRGCDGKEVHEKLSNAIETVREAVYESCKEDDRRLEYLAGRKDSLETAVRVLENFRAEERVKSTFEEYVAEKEQSGCYSSAALAALSAVAEEYAGKLSEVDPESPEGADRIAELLSQGLAQMDEVRADAVVSDGMAMEEFFSAENSVRKKLLGYLFREDGFRGGCTLILHTGAVLAVNDVNYVTLFGVSVRLTGEGFTGGYRVCLLLPDSACGYAGYRVMARGEDGTLHPLDTQTDGSTLFFEAAEGEREFVVIARETVDLGWLVVLLSCLCVLETLALLYVAVYLFRNRTFRTRAASVAPVALLAVLLPASALPVCIALGAVCVLEGIALAVLLAAIAKRENPRKGGKKK